MFVPFTVLFEEANSQTIQYHEKTIYRFYNVDKTGKYTLHFSDIERKSKFFQCILFLFDNCKGKMLVNGKEENLPKGSFSKMMFWEDDMPKSFDIGFYVEEGSVIVCNGSDPLGTKEICHHLTNSCAMIIDKIGENRVRFYCNDHENDADFDDLIFDMEIIEQE